MPTVTIYGASDDLIEVEGDVPGCDEYNSIDAPLYVELSTGDAFKVEYTDEGVWRVTLHEKGALHTIKSLKNTSVVTVPAEGSDSKNYSDRLTVTGPFAWVEAWEAYPPTVAEKRRKIGHRLADDEDGFDRDRLLSDADVKSLWEIVAHATRRAAEKK